jgi:hypothetical protein
MLHYEVLPWTPSCSRVRWARVARTKVAGGLRVIVNSAYTINTLIIDNDDFIGRQSWCLQLYLAIGLKSR